MSIVYSDILRIEDTEANISGLLRNKQLGFANDNTRKMVYKTEDGNFYHFSPDEYSSTTEMSGIASGNVGYISKFTGSSELSNSIIYEASGSKIGINTLTPQATLDVNGSGNFRSNLIVSGNVGIGTISPEAKLHLVDGSVRVSISNYSGLLAANTVGTLSNHDFYIATNNTNKMIITNDGSVGIGTSSPASLLHIKGSDPYLSIESTTGTGFFQYVNTDNYMRVHDGSNYTMTWRNSQVGIMDTTPTYTLDVTGSGRFTQQLKVDTINSCPTDVDKFLVSSGGLIQYRTGANVLSDIGAETSGAAATVQGNLNTHTGLTTTAHGLGASAFHTDTYYALNSNISGTQHYLSKFNAAGNGVINSQVYDDGTSVGIGIIPSSVKLHVYSNQNSTNESNCDFLLGRGKVNNYINMYAGVNQSSKYCFIGSVEWNQAYTPLVLQPGGGNVGIGTTSPASLLHIKGSNPYISLESTTATGFLQYLNDSNTMRVYDGTDYTMAWRGGKVGINQQAPQYTLDVDGSGRFVNDLTLDSLTNASVGYVKSSTAGVLSRQTGVPWSDLTGTVIDHSALNNKNTEANVKHLTDAQVSALHSAVTITDSTSIDLSLTDQQLSAAAIFGTSSGTVCQGNDSRLSDSRIASDVYAWAKSATKPSYTYTEVGADASGAAATVQSNLTTHANLTTSAHGGIVANNDSRLSDARVASDVSAWAKAATKPSYTYNEVGAFPATHGVSSGNIPYANATTSFADSPLIVEGVGNINLEGDGKYFKHGPYARTYNVRGLNTNGLGQAYGTMSMYNVYHDGTNWKALSGGHGTAFGGEEGSFIVQHSQGLSSAEDTIAWSTYFKVGISNSYFNSKLGIGNVSPTAMLDVVSPSGTLHFKTSDPANMGLYISTGRTTNGGYAELNSSYDINATHYMWINYGGYQNGLTQFRDLFVGNGKGNPVAIFRGSNQYVGIGETGQTDYQLDVRNFLTTSSVICNLQGSIGTGQRIGLSLGNAASAGDCMRMYYYWTNSNDASNKLDFTFYGKEDTPVMTLWNSDVVTIGTVTPYDLTHNLSVQKNLFVKTDTGSGIRLCGETTGGITSNYLKAVPIGGGTPGFFYLSIGDNHAIKLNEAGDTQVLGKFGCNGNSPVGKAATATTLAQVITCLQDAGLMA